MKPYVGAVVHYFSPTNRGQASAAIITAVHDDSWVSLFVINCGGGTRFVSHGELGVTWKWIPEPKQVPQLPAALGYDAVFP